MRLVGWTAGSCLAISLMGCATVPPAAEVAANSSALSYSGARGWQSFAAPRAAVLAALNDSMNDLNLGNIRGARDGSVSRLEATTRDKERVVATIRSHRDVTQVTIRVGWFGDQPLTQAILGRMEVRLGSRSPEGIPTTVPSAPSRNPYFAGTRYQTLSCCATSSRLPTTTASFPGRQSHLDPRAFHVGTKVASATSQRGPTCTD